MQRKETGCEYRTLNRIIAGVYWSTTNKEKEEMNIYNYILYY